MRGYIRYLILLVLVLIVLSLLPFRPLKVDGRSMEPTLKHGRTLILDHFYWKAGGLRRGDIVVVNHGEERWVKRLVGKPGDKLQIQTYPDGWIIRVDNLTVTPDAEQVAPIVDERIMGPDEIFVVGDNLNRSTDSTSPEAGAFRLGDVVGIARDWNLSRDFPNLRRRPAVP